MKITIVPNCGGELVVPLDDMRQHLRMDEITVDDDYIESLINAAKDHVEQTYTISLVEQTIEEYFDVFPLLNSTGVELSITPNPIITEVKYRNDEGVDTVWDTNKYMCLNGFLMPVVGEKWPATLMGKNVIKITYTAGYADCCENIPRDIVVAIKLIVADWYLNREDRADSIPKASETLLKKYYKYKA